MQTRPLLAVTAVVSIPATAAAFILRTVAPAPETTRVLAPAMGLGQLAGLVGEAHFPRREAGPIIVRTDLAPHSGVRTEAWLLNAALRTAGGARTALAWTIVRLGRFSARRAR